MKVPKFLEKVEESTWHKWVNQATPRQGRNICFQSLILKVSSKTVADDSLFFTFEIFYYCYFLYYYSEKLRLDALCESIHIIYGAFFFSNFAFF